MKRCPFCAGELKETDLQCPHCSQPLTGLEPLKKEKWFFKTSLVVLALLSVGPLALPLIWFHPRWSRRVKILTTAATLILTVVLGKALDTALKTLMENYRVLVNTLAPLK